MSVIPNDLDYVVPIAPGQLPTYEGFENLPASGEAIATSASGLTYPDQLELSGLYGILDEGVGTGFGILDETKSDILGAPAFTAYRDQLLQYSDPGYEAITRAMLADESRSITAAAVATGENAAAQLRRSGVGVTGLTGAFQTLGAVRGAGERASLESNRLGVNANLRLEATGELGNLASLESEVIAKFGDQRFELHMDALNLILTTPGTLAERTEGVRQWQLGFNLLEEEGERERIALEAQVDAVDMNAIDTGLQVALGCLGQGAGFMACIAAAGLGWAFGAVTGDR